MVPIIEFTTVLTQHKIQLMKENDMLLTKLLIIYVNVNKTGTEPKYYAAQIRI
jgi:hypothetical protein